MYVCVIDPLIKPQNSLHNPLRHSLPACAGGAVGGPAYFVFNPPNGGCACYYNEDCASNIAQAPVNTAELYAFNGASCMPPGR